MKTIPVPQETEVPHKIIPAPSVVTHPERMTKHMNTTYPVSEPIKESGNGEFSHYHRKSVKRNGGSLEHAAVYVHEFPETGHARDLIAAWESGVSSPGNSKVVQDRDIPEDKRTPMPIYSGLNAREMSSRSVGTSQQWMGIARGLEACFVLDQCRRNPRARKYFFGTFL